MTSHRSIDSGLGAVLRSRSFLAGLAGVALVAGGGISAVALLTRDRASPPARAEVAAASPAVPLPEAVPAPAPAPPPPRDPPAVREARARRAAAPMLTRLVPSRGRFVITRAIEQQATELSRCLGRDRTQAAAVAASRRGMVAPESAGVLLLELEPRRDEIRIVDVAVQEQGGGADAELACARRVLKGFALELPGTTPAARVSMAYPLP